MTYLLKIVIYHCLAINMVIIHSYVSSPEGKSHYIDPIKPPFKQKNIKSH